MMKIRLFIALCQYSTYIPSYLNDYLATNISRYAPHYFFLKDVTIIRYCHSDGENGRSTLITCPNDIKTPSYSTKMLPIQTKYSITISGEVYTKGVFRGSINPPSVSPPTSSYLDHHSSIPMGSYNQHDLSLFPEHKQSMGGTSENSYDNYRGDTSDEEIETYSPKEAIAKKENGRSKSKEHSNKSKEKHVTDNDSHSPLVHSPLAVEYDENSNSPIHISPPDSRGNDNTSPSYAYTSDDVNYSDIDKDIDSVEIPSKDSNNRGYIETKKPSKYFPKSSIEYVSLSSQSTITPQSPLSPLPAHMNTIKEEKEDIYLLKSFRATIDVHYVLHSKYRAKSQECCVNHGNDSTHRHNASIPMGEGHKGHLLDIERGLNEIEVELDTENQLNIEREKNKNLGEKITIDVLCALLYDW
ncbi:hypothetical protein WA158_003354 [Blastocystis sp. Blastoise]